MRVDPKQFGLHPKTVLEQIDTNTIAIVIDRKSRVIMADGLKILEKVQGIQKQISSTRVVLKTTAPVCSKTTVFLEENGILVISG